MDTMETNEREVSSMRHKFYTVLKNISSHPFVSEASSDKRNKFREIMNKSKEELLDQRLSGKLVGFAFGSVGVGVANMNSDLDGVVFFETNGSDNSELVKESIFRVIESEVVDVDVEDIRSSLLQRFGESIFSSETVDFFLGIDNPQRNTPIRKAARIFMPSLNEFSDHTERELVDKWRKRFLEVMIREQPDRAEEIWEHIRTYLKCTMIDYEKVEIGFSRKRVVRLKEHINRKILSRFPGNLKAQERAKRYVELRRKFFEYPSLDEMLGAYNLIR